MADVIPIHQKRRFNLDDARAMLPVVRRVTERAVARYRATRARLDGGPRPAAECEAIEEELHAHVAAWRRDVTRLGCAVKGLWIVTFDRGDGYLCWKYPEEDVLYFHDYEGGFAGRVPVAMMPESARHGGAG